MNIQKLRTNHLENPLGYLLDTLSLSWIVTGKNEPDMETKVVIAADAAFGEVLFESDWLEEINALDFQPEISLLPQKRYYWKVTAQAAGELLAESESAWFETAKQVGIMDSAMDHAWRGSSSPADCEETICDREGSSGCAFVHLRIGLVRI